MNTIKKILPSILIILIILYTLPSKFANADETGYIFYTVGDWMKDHISLGIGEFFTNVGGYLIASIESIAIILLILGFFNKKLRFYGGLLALVVLNGAVFFHIFTPLGINMNNDSGRLFVMAIVGLISAFYITFTEHKSCIIK